MKVCTKCGVEKDESEFLRRANGGFYTGCKSCRKQHCKKYYNENREELLKDKKEYSIKNKDRINQYRENNKDKIRETKKKWRENNKDKIKELYTAWEKEKYKTDPYFKFRRGLSSRIRISFKLYSKNGKTKACKDYGIDFKAIYDKIGYKDDPTMHLDHIIPLSVFDLDNPEHVRLAHLPENLRWLNPTENIIKSDNIDMQLIKCSLALTIIAQEIGLI